MDVRIAESYANEAPGHAPMSVPEGTASVDFGSGGPPGGHAVMFWVLVGMAVLVFAPCVLVPIWMQTEELIRAEREAQAVLHRLEMRIGEQKRLMDGLRNDPSVNERVARRDLRFQHAAEELVPVSEAAPARIVSARDSAVQETLENGDATLVVTVQAVRRWLPDLPWVELFGRPPNRTIFLLMAAALVVTAFVLFGSTAPARTSSTGHHT